MSWHAPDGHNGGRGEWRREDVRAEEAWAAYDSLVKDGATGEYLTAAREEVLAAEWEARLDARS